ncbi:DUF3107 domain-containing protein [Demequina sp. TTPB684]|uniref:DUF3107 domain-containing protein n=1 Tax=unclassified Demequina TaxID=2620311 RepID=UPI001CF5E6A2|nr:MULTISPECIES: DUF3107 domain-containing protein [unclassified Demequina]MCB2412061.1 DUF3107 domain-containing protein [Demequina sp. TTPB684]UPU88516.1 DUF3107 domain-containing protein [Demequina sp. TMPB413]
MEIRIGIQNVSRELMVETDKTSDEVAVLVSDALKGGTFDITDAKGRRVIVPAGSLGYIDIGEEEKRRVGFGG